MVNARKTEQVTRYLPGILALAVAFWLVFPFIRLEQADYTRANILVYRLIVGITIFLVMLGKMGFDIFFPQGMARKVSDLKSVMFIIFGILILAFIVFIIIQAGSLFLGTYPQTTDYNL
ncbi:MAG TPA: hypothetical protein PKZ60_03915 [Candidatus Saccharicenans sp.]|jgi:hypothetical protein|nr:hypothetical protein [Candidatus Saccharicenans sp.]HPU93662.1 hypothetical protein [Candidatus Saccharicenans sp.]